jgi:hypothetical protein
VPNQYLLEFGGKVGRVDRGSVEEVGCLHGCDGFRLAENMESACGSYGRKALQESSSLHG